LLIALAAGCVSCAPTERGADGDRTWAGTITTEGNVTTVINESGSIWGGEARLVEEMSIGVDIGEGEYMLGHIANIYATDELVYLTDTQEPAVRVYDTEGRYVRTIGSGPGQGPGEYETPVLVNGTADGTLFVYDANGRRLTAYGAEGGTIDSRNLDDGACCAWRMSVAPDGTLWMPVEQPGFLSPTGEYRYGARAYRLDEGPVGDIRWHPVWDFPSLTFEVDGRESSVPFSPASTWTLSADGGVTVGTSDRYRFEVHKIDGSMLVVERRAEPVPVHPDEAEWQRRWRVQGVRNRGNPAFDISLDIPDHKPAFIGFAPDAYGGTWVWRTGPSRHLGGDCEDDPYTTDLATSRDNSCWVSDRFFDIFDPEGRYLGWVEQPNGLERWNAQLNLFPMGDRVYAIIETAEGVPTVKRYRLVPPGEEQ
jgi:hypothetical protein